jgi:hypothetical protein
MTRAFYSDLASALSVEFRALARVGSHPATTRLFRAAARTDDVRIGFNFSDDLCHDFLSGHYRRPLGLKICPPPRIADQLRLRDLRIQGP